MGEGYKVPFIRTPNLATRIEGATSDADKLFSEMKDATVRDDFGTVGRFGRQTGKQVDTTGKQVKLVDYLEGLANGIRQKQIDVGGRGFNPNDIAAAADNLAQSFRDMERHSREGTVTEQEKAAFLEKAKKAMPHPQTEVLKAVEHEAERKELQQKTRGNQNGASKAQSATHKEAGELIDRFDRGQVKEERDGQLKKATPLKDMDAIGPRKKEGLPDRPARGNKTAGADPLSPEAIRAAGIPAPRADGPTGHPDGSFQPPATKVAGNKPKAPHVG